MIEKGKISAFQMAMIMYPVVVATGDLIIPAFTAKFAKRDVWLSPILGSLLGFLIVYIVYQLHNLFPKQTLVQYVERIFGRIPGKVIGITYLFFILHGNSTIIKQYGGFITGVFLRTTPTIVVIGSMLLVCSFAVRGGLEVIARCAQLFVPLVMLTWILILVLLIPDMETKNMLPVLANGIMPSIQGAIPTSSWFAHFVFINFMLPFLTDLKKGVKWGMISVCACMLTLTLITISTLFIFGDITSQLTYPVMMAIKYINVGTFIDHVESIMMAIWVIGTFIKISVFYYAFVLGISQWLNLSDYRPMVFPSGFLLVIFTIWVAPDAQEFFHYLGTYLPFVNMTFEIVLPVMLLLTALLQKKFRDIREGKMNEGPL
ncbi:GerAB/ArcD/ProY family transporter [Paenibacillus sp. WC2504]|uniref:GerAB/ArcD/ProY family transporter n=1 Tax=Paenibacillus sp. WC2504 TaxID=3461403 RepID=UPI00404560A5